MSAASTFGSKTWVWMCCKRATASYLSWPVLTTVRWPFLALAMSSSDPDIKSIMPSLPCPTVNFMLQRETDNKPDECGCSSTLSLLLQGVNKQTAVS